jgi:hypothetical protein
VLTETPWRTDWKRLTYLLLYKRFGKYIIL